MRIAGIIAIPLVGLLVIAGACASPAPAPTVPVTPVTPTMPTSPAPAPPTPPTPSAVQGPYDIWIPGNAFNPTILTVPLGTKVTWTNKDGNPHTVTSNNGLFDSFLGYGQSFSYTFTDRGTYNYYCKPHDEMSGKVIVE